MTPIISTFYKRRRALLIGSGLLCNMVVTFFTATGDWSTGRDFIYSPMSVTVVVRCSLLLARAESRGELVQFIAGRTYANVRLTM